MQVVKIQSNNQRRALAELLAEVNGLVRIEDTNLQGRTTIAVIHQLKETTWLISTSGETTKLP